MHWVHENQMAFDSSQLGFPSILGCQAICFHTTRGLYGFHDLKTSSQASGLTDAQASDAKLKVFAKWVKDDCFKVGETGIALYGIINRDEQYNPDAAGNADWKAVLLGLAGHLTFTGPVLGSRINSHLEKKSSDKDKSAYVQFDLAGNTCTVGFKRWSKLEADVNNKEKPADQKIAVFRKFPLEAGKPLPEAGKPKGVFQVEDLYGQGKVAPVVRKDDSKGFNLNRIAIKQFIKFQ